MSRYTLLCFMMACCMFSAGQTQPKTRNVAKTDAASVSARKQSVLYTDGLKSYYAGNTNEALKVFNGIVLDNPKHDASYFMLSKIYTDQKNYHDAVDQLQKAIKVDKKNVWYKVSLAQTYMKMEEWGSAAKLWEQVCKDKNNNEYFVYSMAECYYELNKVDKVIDCYNRMEEIMGANDELTRVKVSLWLYVNNVKAAVGEYDKLIKQYPHNADYYVKAGSIYQSNDMMPQAMSYYEKAAELNSEDPQLNLTMASYWEQQGQVEKQMACLKRVFQNPAVELSLKVPYMRRTLMNALNKQDEKMLNYADQLAQALAQVHPEAGDGYAYQASIMFARKKYAEAAPLYERAIAIDNTSFSIWQDYCKALKHIDRMPNLIKYEKELVELFPTNAEILCNLGLAYLKQHDAQKAIAYLLKAKTYAYESAQQAVIFNALSQAYTIIGDDDTAADYARKARQKMNN